MKKKELEFYEEYKKDNPIKLAESMAKLDTRCYVYDILKIKYTNYNFHFYMDIFKRYMEIDNYEIFKCSNYGFDKNYFYAKKYHSFTIQIEKSEKFLYDISIVFGYGQYCNNYDDFEALMNDKTILECQNAEIQITRKNKKNNTVECYEEDNDSVLKNVTPKMLIEKILIPISKNKLKFII